MKRRKQKKPSFFERLTGVYDDEDFLNEIENDFDDDTPKINKTSKESVIHEEPERQLSIDLINSPNDIIIHSAIPGVDQDEIDISVTREVVNITVRSAHRKEIKDADYFYQELFWGSQTRTVVLPQEVEVDEAKADTKNGVLTIVLPKIDKERKTKLRVGKR